MSEAAVAHRSRESLDRLPTVAIRGNPLNEGETSQRWRCDASRAESSLRSERFSRAARPGRCARARSRDRSGCDGRLRRPRPRSLRQPADREALRASPRRTAGKACRDAAAEALPWPPRQAPFGVLRGIAAAPDGHRPRAFRSSPRRNRVPRRDPLEPARDARRQDRAERDPRHHRAASCRREIPGASRSRARRDGDRRRERHDRAGQRAGGEDLRLSAIGAAREVGRSPRACRTPLAPRPAPHRLLRGSSRSADGQRYRPLRRSARRQRVPHRDQPEPARDRDGPPRLDLDPRRERPEARRSGARRADSRARTVEQRARAIRLHRLARSAGAATHGRELRPAARAGFQGQAQPRRGRIHRIRARRREPHAAAHSRAPRVLPRRARQTRPRDRRRQGARRGSPEGPRARRSGRRRPRSVAGGCRRFAPTVASSASSC